MDDTLASDYQANNGSGPDLSEGLISKLHDPRAIVSKTVIMAMLILALLMLGCLFTVAFPRVASHDFNGFETLPVLLRDLVEDGLIKKGQKGFVFGDIVSGFDFLKGNGIDVSIGELKVAEQNTFDFVFAPRSCGPIDGLLKDGGLVITLLGCDPMNQLKNYKVVYFRRFDNVVVAMRKMGMSAKARKPTLVFHGVASDEQKKAALKGLEPVYLEPPRRAKKSRKIKFLPNLLKDSLVGYPRRVFISDSSTLEWFYKNYPMRNQEFEVHDLANGGKTSKTRIPLLENRKAKESGAHQGTTSRWLAKHVRREDFVVMKADAQLVEEMLKDKTINLVDELFLECKHQWQHGGGENGGKRPYWQCLSLYGKVRDEGIAVHQWWG